MTLTIPSLGLWASMAAHGDVRGADGEGRSGLWLRSSRSSEGEIQAEAGGKGAAEAVGRSWRGDGVERCAT